MKIGILGGTFNPIHYGHITAAQDVRDRLKLDKVLFVPSYLPPHKQDEDLPSAEQRLEMVRLAISKNPAFEPSDVEIKRKGRSYTIDTIAALKQSNPGTDYYFIAGIDCFLDIKSWNRWNNLLSLCNFVVIARPGYRFRDLEQLDFMAPAVEELKKLDENQLSQAIVQSGAFTIYLATIPLSDASSTDIRERIKRGMDVKYLLPDAVETYIIKNKLYG